ncbi:hypothetical protein GE09DRAFT_1097799, partial [Coniochaeta sp. 2T2.1]
DAEFDNEVRMYNRLRPIQGTVVPVVYGVATGCGEDGREERAPVISNVRGRQLGSISYTEHSLDELRGMVNTALEAIYQLGVSPTDTNLANYLIVGDRVMVIDISLGFRRRILISLITLLSAIGLWLSTISRIRSSGKKT